DWIECKNLSKALWLHQQHARRNDPACRMSCKMAEYDAQRIERCQPVQRMLRHGVVGKFDGGFRPIAVAATAPINSDHPQAAGKQGCGEFDPVLAGEIAMD